MNEPLAQRLRPKTLADVCGQQHLLAEGQVFRRTIESGRIPNMIFSANTFNGLCIKNIFLSMYNTHRGFSTMIASITPFRETRTSATALVILFFQSL